MRPLGVKLIAAVHWLRGAAYAIGALALLGLLHLGTRFMSAIANDTFLQRLTTGLGNTLAIGLLLFALFWIVLGFGIWAMKNWARVRVLTLVFAVIWLLWGLMKLSHFPTPWHIARVIVDLAIVVYLVLPDVKRLFTGATPA
jgi:uncharacterized membrane protein (DUF2068 family)